MTAARPTVPAPYDGQPFAPIAALSAAEHAWGGGLVQRGWPELGWHVVGRDAQGHLVAVTCPAAKTRRTCAIAIRRSPLQDSSTARQRCRSPAPAH